MSDLAKIETSSLYPVTSESLSPKLEQAIMDIASMSELFKPWNRSHSDVMWGLFNLDHETDTRNLREIGASIKKRRDALTEVHFAYKECLLNAEILEERADIATNELTRRKHLLEAQKQRAYAQMKHESIEGATKDISALKSSYEKILSRVLDKYGKFDEEVFEIEETEYFIRRLFVQAMRDVRECGRIRSGAQRDLEQMGIEPVEALRDIEWYLSQVTRVLDSGKTVTRECRDKWAAGLVDKYSPIVSKKLSDSGYRRNHDS